jgi:hypothetical protein
MIEITFPGISNVEDCIKFEEKLKKFGVKGRYIGGLLIIGNTVYKHGDTVRFFEPEYILPEKSIEKATRLAACIKSDLGNLLPHTMRGSIQECEEYATTEVLAWERLKELGCKIVQVEIREV